MNEKYPERGVWIVYDLEANREIQNLLQKKKFAFRFDPSLKIEKKKTLTEVGKAIDELDDEINSKPAIMVRPFRILPKLKQRLGIK